MVDLKNETETENWFSTKPSNIIHERLYEQNYLEPMVKCVTFDIPEKMNTPKMDFGVSTKI